MKWLKRFGLAFAAILSAVIAVLAARRSSRHVGKARAYEEISKSLDPKVDLDKAEKYADLARVEMSKAETAKKKAEEHLNNVGEKDETLDSIIDAYNARVRSRAKRT